MGKVSDCDIARIREDADIVGIIGEKVKLEERGKEFLGLCPFHRDEHPSLTVNRRKGIYKCFSCGAGGSVFDFVMHFDGVGFSDAVKYVADRVGYKLTFDGEDSKRYAETASIYDALGKAARLYQNEFWNSRKAQDFLLGKRGIEPETARDFGAGYAPDEWEFLINRIGPGTKDGVPLEVLNKAGLVRPRRKGEGYYDYFRARILFPIYDLTGRIVGFGGRDVSGDEEAPKFLNTPETPIFDKSRVLFGLHQASRQIKEEGRAIVTEGYIDAMVGQQSGLPMIAMIGTSFTREQAKILERKHSGLEIIFAFDGDEAGRRAAFKTSKQLLGNADAHVCFLPDGKDPDEILLGREYVSGDTLFESGEVDGRRAFDAILRDRKTVFETYVSGLLNGRKLDGPEAVSGLLRGIAEDFREIPSDVLPIYISAMSKRIGVDEDSIRIALAGRRAELNRGLEIPSAEQCETELLYGFMLLPSVVERFRGAVSENMFTNSERRAIFNYLFEGGNVDSVHTPLLQSASEATDRIMHVPGNECLRAHVLHGLLSPPSSVKRRNLGYFEHMYNLLRGWQAFRTVSEAGRRGYGIERVGLLVDGLGNTLEDWESDLAFKRIEDLPGANADGKCLQIKRLWKGEQIVRAFGSLGEYLLAHGHNFSQAIGSSPATDIGTSDKLVSIDLEDSPSADNQIFSIAGTTYRRGELKAFALFARDEGEEKHVLAGFLPFAAGFDKVLTYRGAHDLAAIKRRVETHFKEGSKKRQLVGHIRGSHRDVAAILERKLDGQTLDKRLRTAETHFFKYDRGGFDVPSSMIPEIYEEFVRTGKAGLAEQIIRHNIIDTVTPLALLHKVSAA